MNRDELQDKYRGAMLGVAIGDAIGAPFVGWNSISRESFKGREDDPGRLTYTDETHLAIGVAESLIDRGGFDHEHLRGILLRNYEEEPWRRYRSRLGQFFLALRQGIEPDATTANASADAAGCAVPAALFARDDLPRVAQLTRDIGGLMALNGWPSVSTILLATAVALLVPIPSVRRLQKSSYLQSLRAQIEDPLSHRVLDCIETLLPDSPPERVTEYFRQTVSPPFCVPNALYAFLRCPESFHEVVYFAISLGGDTDTNGSLAGGLAGWRVRFSGHHSSRRSGAAKLRDRSSCDASPTRCSWHRQMLRADS